MLWHNQISRNNNSTLPNKIPSSGLKYNQDFPRCSNLLQSDMLESIVWGVARLKQLDDIMSCTWLFLPSWELWGIALNLCRQPHPSVGSNVNNYFSVRYVGWLVVAHTWLSVYRDLSPSFYITLSYIPLPTTISLQSTIYFHLLCEPVQAVTAKVILRPSFLPSFLFYLRWQEAFIKGTIATPPAWDSSLCLARWGMPQYQHEIDPNGYLIYVNGR